MLASDRTPEDATASPLHRGVEMSRRSREVRRVQALTVSPDAICRVYWGSHGCDKLRGHAGPHICASCYDPKETKGYVGAPPYYGPETRFYGEDALAAERMQEALSG
jgi:hypothetical protein